MHENDFISIIANQLGIQQKQVIATVKLLNEGSTVPFIARYRKELTNALDEVQIENIRLLNLKFTLKTPLLVMSRKSTSVKKAQRSKRIIQVAVRTLEQDITVTLLDLVQKPDTGPVASGKK
jgi:uncharacterized protein